MPLIDQLDRLAAFEPAPYPVVSLYLNTQPNQHGRVVAIVLREKEGARIELHKDLALGNCPQLQHQDRLVVAESREETTIQKEGGHAIRSPFCDARQP